MEKVYRKGAIGALLDIYEQSITDFKKVIAIIPDSMLPIVVDPVTTDESCQSIQAILTHVVHAGYGYATSIHNLKGNTSERPNKRIHLSISAYQNDLDDVFAFTETVFKDLKDHELEEANNALKIKTSWGQLYDIEQLTEHAIVHILRHQRQLEKICLQTDIATPSNQ